MFEFDELINLLLKGSIGRVLFEVYKLYFAHELNGAADIVTVTKDSQKALNQFTKDFDICPGLVTKAKVFNMLVDDSKREPIYAQTGLQIVQAVVSRDTKKPSKPQSHIGRYFTFPRFIDFLVQVALASFADPFFSRNNEQPMIAAEMVVLVLERMELSTGFQEIEKKSNRTHQSKATLLPSRTVIAQIKATKD